ncbi:MAG: hypothetical protein ACI9WH_000492, partial [Glaciecola sp.]
MFSPLVLNIIYARRYVMLSCLVLSVLLGPNNSYAAQIDLTSANILEINNAFDTGMLNSEKLVQLY